MNDGIQTFDDMGEEVGQDLELDEDSNFDEFVEEPEEPAEDETRLKRPSPPRGFVRFDWQRVKHESGATVNGCPQCGHFGSEWNAGGCTEPEADLVYQHLEYFQEIYEAHCPPPEVALAMTNLYPNDFLFELNYRGDTSIWDSAQFGGFRGVALKLHWSRFGTGRCTGCGVEFWHDFVGQKWAYYYKPTKGQLGLF